MRFARSRRGLAAASIAATVASAGLASALPAAASTAAAPHAVAARRGPTVVITCARRAVIRPGSYVISCADANNYLTGLSWKAWGWRQTAYGQGTDRFNDCTPTCGASRVRSYPVLTVLWRARPLRHHRGTYFSRLTLIYQHNVPRYSGTTATFVLPG